jgi:hypothetical protein
MVNIIQKDVTVSVSSVDRTISLEAGANITVNQILGVAADIPFSPD